MDEIYKYSVVAAVIADENEFDIIHAHDWLAYPADSRNGSVGKTTCNSCARYRLRQNGAV